MRKILLIFILMVAGLIVYIAINIGQSHLIKIGEFEGFYSDELKNCLVISNYGNETSGEIICANFKIYYKVGNYICSVESEKESSNVVTDCLNGIIKRTFVTSEQKNFIQVIFELEHPKYSSDTLIYPYCLSLMSFDYNERNKDELRKIFTNVELTIPKRWLEIDRHKGE